jgi:hypothetical protein
MRRSTFRLHICGTTLAALALACQPSPRDGDQTAAGTPAAPDSTITVPASAPAQASPRDTARGTIGSASVLVDYGRPSRRGREIFGALVPYDQVWRTGANSATTLVLGGPVSIGGRPVDAGTYTLYSLPARNGWTLVVNRQTGQWGTEYNQAQDLVRVPMVVSKAATPVDTFTIAIEGGATGRLVFAWDTLQGSVDVAPR